jgi:hypothetical protein
MIYRNERGNATGIGTGWRRRAGRDVPVWFLNERVGGKSVSLNDDVYYNLLAAEEAQEQLAKQHRWTDWFAKRYYNKRGNPVYVTYWLRGYAVIEDGPTYEMIRSKEYQSTDLAQLELDRRAKRNGWPEVQDEL